MKFNEAAAILLLCATTGFAQDRIPDLLRKGILAEDSEQKPAAAIQQYQAVMNQFAEERQMAATALFRMAECYRKQGQKPQAIAAYQRVLKEFSRPDQTRAAGRTTLTTIYAVAPADSAQPLNQKSRRRSKPSSPLAPATGQPSKTRKASSRSNSHWSGTDRRRV